MNATPRPWVWGEAKHLGTAQEEFDIAAGYWKKWQRCEEEKTELVEAAKHVADELRANQRLLSNGGKWPTNFYVAQLEGVLREAIAKAERP